MLDVGVIKPSKSPWASPIVIVRKSDGSIRFCVDDRKVNEVTIKDSYPLPRINDSLDVLHKSSWFSVLDLVRFLGGKNGSGRPRGNSFCNK